MLELSDFTIALRSNGNQALPKQLLKVVDKFSKWTKNNFSLAVFGFSVVFHCLAKSKIFHTCSTRTLRVVFDCETF